MDPTTQDLVKGIDITAQTNVTGSQLNQLVDAGRTASDKGLVIETTDSAADTPVTPDPNGDYDGITPTWWTRYIWRRLPFDAEDEVLLYKWDPSIEEDADLLFWSLIDKQGREALTLATSQTALITTAQNTADTAQTAAETAQDGVDTHTGEIATLTASLNATIAALNDLYTVVGTFFSAGDLKQTLRPTTYSTSVDQGWLLCDGTAVDRTIFAGLFAVIGVTFGPGNGTTTFNLPDFRGRTLIGSGQGAGLTLRNIGLTNVGVESVLLTAVQSGIAAHSHDLISLGKGEASGNTNATSSLMVTFVPGVAGTLTNLTGVKAATAAAEAHENMQPSAVATILIKT